MSQSDRILANLSSNNGFRVRLLEEQFPWLTITYMSG